MFYPAPWFMVITSTFKMVFAFRLVSFTDFLPHSDCLPQVKAKGDQMKRTTTLSKCTLYKYVWVFTLLETFGIVYTVKIITVTFTVNIWQLFQ